MKNLILFGQGSLLRAPDFRLAMLCLALSRLAMFRTALAFVVAVAAALTVMTFSGSVLAADREDLDTMTNSTIAEVPVSERLPVRSQGFLVETLNGQVLEQQNSDDTYNPASAVKVLTAYATLKQFGPDFQFETRVLLDGTTDGSRFDGAIYFIGEDPFFDVAKLKDVFAEFKKEGINTVDASLFVSPKFQFAGNAGGQKSASAVKAAFGGGKKRRARALRTANVIVRVKYAQVKTAPATARTLISLKSPTILALLKDMLSRSDNEMAGTFGNLLGGPQLVAQTARKDFGLTSDALSIQTTSGLGVNRVSPRAMIAALRGFKKLLEGFKLQLRDALPIAGIDYGTIFNRFAGSDLKGVMVGKTGTLKRTDNGASVLVGEMSTLLKGQLLFVVFQRGSNTKQLRQSQNQFLENLLVESGGPGMKYSS